jgi:menaquinol-cytochrome c reductase iron-sulfur subunit
MEEKSSESSQPECKRRTFIAGSIYTLTSLIGGAVAASVSPYLLGTPQSQGDGWADAGDVSRLEPESPQELTFDRVRVDGWRVRNEKASAWVIVDHQQRVTAFTPLCTHLGCAYHWEAKSKLFSCPCHGSKFNERGEVISGPANRPLDKYLVKLEGNRLWLGPIQSTRHS